ncbi:MAG: rod shape-determining protein MreC [Spirochaetaceae bacterium]|jgi:rod shape-determining protein MreC|nr:rod shape-determining protein MreC [Spirochaetaceae bacterium]
MRVRENRKRGRRFSRDAYVFAALTLVSFSILLFSTRSFIVSVRDAGLSAFSGIRGGIYGISSFMSRTVLSIRELASLRREYNELAGRMTRYEQLERSAAEIRQENNRLREQLGFSNILRYRHIPAQLIGRDPDNLFSALVINKGTRDLVRVNMPVIAFQDGAQALVGKVIQAAHMESLVMPLYDGSSFISARFAESRYEGIVEGQGNPDLPLVMRFIRKRAMDEISAGDVIVSAGLGGVYPMGLNIGRVSRILYQEYETSMGVELESAIDFSRLEYVFVLDAEGGEDG